MNEAMGAEREGGLPSSGLTIVLLACVAAYATVRLADARPTAGLEPPLATAERLAERAGPVEALVAPATTPHLAQVHPLLPAALAGLDDELLSSPMLHHPPFATEVDRWVRLWSDGFSEWMPSYLARMRWFEAHVDQTLARRGLPWSLRYLPVIESGYSPSAVSSASAVGMWQFMAPTARELGVEVTSDVDDRRDPFVSTAAATEYLLQLREQFGSWFLALAAYNAGPDRIEGLIARYLPDVERSDAVYWALRNVLPKETADFVPNFLGAAIVASDPEAYGYEVPHAPPFDFEEIPVLGSITFETAARAAGTTADEIARLNPEYIRRRTPSGRQVDLRLPRGRGDAFRAYFASADAAPGPGS